MKPVIRIWLNRTYGENVFFITLLRNNPDHVRTEIHASHVHPDSPVLAAADRASIEPDGLSPGEYVDFALDYCARHRVDVFVPRLHQHAIATHRSEFLAVGTVVLAPPAEAIATFTDKAVGYTSAVAAGLPVSPWWRVRTADQLLDAANRIEDAGHRPCLKPVTGEGGVGFRVLTRRSFDLSWLASEAKPEIALHSVLACLRDEEDRAGTGVVDWLVMPYLSSPEVSVDCLADADGRLRVAVGRTKNGRRRGFTVDPAYLEPARHLVETFGLSYLTNVQFRHHGGVPVLLDINTRPAGGLHQLAHCGLNLPWAATRLALGEPLGDLDVAPRRGKIRTGRTGDGAGSPTGVPHHADVRAYHDTCMSTGTIVAGTGQLRGGHRATGSTSGDPVSGDGHGLDTGHGLDGDGPGRDRLGDGGPDSDDATGGGYALDFEYALVATPYPVRPSLPPPRKPLPRKATADASLQPPSGVPHDAALRPPAR